MSNRFDGLVCGDLRIRHADTGHNLGRTSSIQFTCGDRMDRLSTLVTRLAMTCHAHRFPTVLDV